MRQPLCLALFRMRRLVSLTRSVCSSNVVAMRIIATSLLVLVVLFSAACRPPEPVPYTKTWHELIEELVNTDRIARMDTRTSFLVSSTDPTGGNDDFNQPLRLGPDGWWVIADLEGPGYISRFWFTGAAEDGSHRVRFYFDNEEEPRIDLTLGEFCGGMDPYRPPLAVYENYCWYNLIPIPYEERVVIMVERGGHRPGNWPRLFHQINYHTLGPNENIATFPRTFTDEDLELIESVRDTWERADFHQPKSDEEDFGASFNLAPGATADWIYDEGAGILRQLVLTPDLAARSSAISREAALREVIVNIYWDGHDAPSVSVPLGDFFGAFWRRNRFRTLYIGSDGDDFISDFPKPFASSARVELVNEGNEPIDVDLAVRIEPLAEFAAYWGYFHSAWQRTNPEDVGSPHVALSSSGTGKFVGCMLAVVSADRSWWILEADEMIRVDNERTPGWRGTGLEDYFNGGWYYQNAIIRLLAGIPFKMPFRVLQYRLHLMDPVHFNDSIDMTFERGPLDESRGWMESVAYYYMAQPQAAASTLRTPAERTPPDDGFGEGTLMTEINNMERIGDYQGAHDLIDLFLERYPQFPFADMLRLRQVAYIEHRDGIEVARPLYESLREQIAETNALAQLEDLLWFHEDESHALLSAYANSPTAVFFNGQPVGSVRAADELSFFRVQIEPGRHALALQSRHHPYPNWVQAYLRTHQRDVYTTPAWRHRFNARGAWTSPGFNDRSWPVVGGTGVKGPPEVPFIWVVPHAHINMQSIAVGLRPSQDWNDQSALAAFRYEFHWP